VEAFLLQLLGGANRTDPVVDYALAHIRGKNGLVNINDLCGKLGYSKRYLDLKFADLVGVSPKTLAGITWFQKFFRAAGAGAAQGYLSSDLYDYYYDQSHYIKEFKCFTGYTPLAYQKAKNDFGQLFYGQ
jgi:methylphosphotriester-DNA--protein-cysteine methyltransferase